MGLVKIYTGRDTLDAHHVRNHLERHGIAATVLGEALGTALGELPFTMDTRPAVWVDDIDAEVARHCITEFTDPDALPLNDHPDWSCAACGESSEGQFTACWNCGTEREAS